MVDILTFQPAHSLFVKKWLKDYGLDEALIHDYGDHSWVSVHGNDLVSAIGLKFLGSTAVLVGLITNPEAHSELRHHSINALTRKVIEAAKQKGSLELLAWTTNEGILNRSFEHGFKVLPQIMIRRDLRGE